MIRLLNTPIIGPSAAIVDSSWIDIEAGLVTNGMRRMPPAFSAKATSLMHGVASSAAPTARLVKYCCILPSPCYRSSQTSSMRQPLKRLLVITVSPLR